MHTIIVDVDDLSPSKPGLDMLLAVKDHLPNFKVTCFTPAMDQGIIKKQVTIEKVEEWTTLLKKYPWIEIAPHGFLHIEHEMEVNYADANKIIDGCEHMFDKIKLPYVKIWKSPYWQTSLDCYMALRDRGYVVAIDKNQPIPNISGLKYYVFNKSLEEPFTKTEPEIVKWHGHVGGTFYNDISWCAASLSTTPTDAKFLTISEYLELYGPEQTN